MEDLAGIRRRCEGTTRRHHVWLVWKLRHDARSNGDVREQRGYQDAARALHRCRSRGSGAARWQYRRRVVRAIDGDPAHQSRKDPRARLMGRQTSCFTPGGTDAQGTGLRCGVLPMVGSVRASRDAGADPRETPRGSAGRDFGSQVHRRDGDGRNARSISRCAGLAAILGCGR